jgi:hypothetical protein
MSPGDCQGFGLGFLLGVVFMSLGMWWTTRK